MNINIWTPTFWKKSIFMSMSLIITLMASHVIYFSYSNYFGASQYYFMVLIKVCLIVVENFMVSILQEDLLVAPLSCFLCMLNLNDLTELRFLKLFFIKSLHFHVINLWCFGFFKLSELLPYRYGY